MAGKGGKNIARRKDDKRLAINRHLREPRKPRTHPPLPVITARVLPGMRDEVEARGWILADAVRRGLQMLIDSGEQPDRASVTDPDC